MLFDLNVQSRAKNLLIYSWFEFSFAMSAQLHAYISVELALKEKVGGERLMLSKLLNQAVKEGWVMDSEFAAFSRIKEFAKDSERKIIKVGIEEQQSLHEAITSPDIALASERYTKLLIRAIPRLRNELAHGNYDIHDGGFETVRICAELINQLFQD